VNSEIEHSVILEQSKVLDIARVADSLIGKQVEVRRSQSRPIATRLMIGDHSVVDLA
jgi:glucose-1-phosphate thymidylyltransferase